MGDLIAYPALTGRHAVEISGDAITLADMQVHAGPCHAFCETNFGPDGNTCALLLKCVVGSINGTWLVPAVAPASARLSLAFAKTACKRECEGCRPSINQQP